MSKITICEGDILWTSKKDTILHSFGGDMVFNAGQRNIWQGEKGIEIGKYEKYGTHKEIVKVDKIILRGKRRKGKLLDGAPHLDLKSGDYSEDEKGFNKLWMEIYTENLKNKDNNPLQLESMAIARANKVLSKIIKFSKETDLKLFENFRNNAEYYAQGDLEKVIQLMIDTMKTNKSNSFEFSDQRLNIAVEKHSNHISFKNAVIDIFKNELKKYKSINEALNKMEIKDEGEGILYPILVDKKVSSPRFPDKISGLGITLNDIWAYEVWVRNITKVKYPWLSTTLTYVSLEFIYYDHFGLDYPDLEKKRNPSPWIAWDHNIFWEWFVLQHFRGYVPFITKVKNSEIVYL